jgi:hypothetical protein
MIIDNGWEFHFENGDGFASSDRRQHEFGSGTVISATAVIEGIDVEFLNRSDRPLGRLQVFLETKVLATIPGENDRVLVFLNAGLRDWSGGSRADDLNGDDAYKGVVRYTVIVNTR